MKTTSKKFFYTARIAMLGGIMIFCGLPASGAQFGKNYEQKFDPSHTIIPTISLPANQSTNSSQPVTLSVTRTYCSTCTPFYVWHANGGRFSGSENSPTITWTPPSVSNTREYTISASIGDGKGKMAHAAMKITVQPTASACNVTVGSPRLYEPGLWTENNFIAVNWQPISNASSYELQESSEFNFSRYTPYILNGSNYSSYTIPNKINGTYYFRIKARSNCGDSGWSNIATHVVKANIAPHTPSSPLPNDGSTAASRTPTLTWQGGDSDGVAEYAVEFGENPNDLYYIQGFGATNSINGSLQIPFSLTPSTTYYWRIKSRDDRNKITTGPTWRFTTASDSADLAMSAISPIGNIANGKTIPVEVIVTNQGNYPSDGGTLRFFYSIYEDGQTKELLYASRSIPPLQIGENKLINTEVRIEGLQAGTSFLVAKIDTYANNRNERDLSNNVRSYPITYLDSNAPLIDAFEFRYTSSNVYKSGHEYSFVYTVLDDIGVTGIDLDYSNDAGTTWINIAKGYPIGNGGYGNSYNWTIPSSTPVGNNFQLRLTAHDTSGNKSTKVIGPYSIINGSAPQVTLTAPLSGEIWDLNSTRLVKWTASSVNGIKSAALYYYFNNNRSSQFLANITGNPGQYSWQIPGLTSYASDTGQIVLRVVDNNNNETTVTGPYFTVRDASAPPPLPWSTPGQATTVPVVSAPYLTQNNNNPTIAVDAAGNAHMAYVYEEKLSPYLGNQDVFPAETTKYTLFYTKRTNNAWSAPVAIKIINNIQDRYNSNGVRAIIQPNIAVGPTGTPIIVWTESVNSAANLSEIFYSAVNGPSWSPPFGISNNSKIGSFTWSNLVSLPGNYAHFSRMAAINNYIYALGIAGDYLLFRYDISNNSWRQYADIPSGFSWNGVQEGDVCANNSHLYAVDSLGNFIRYNPGTDSWEQRAALLSPGNGVRLASIAGKVYAVGANGTTSLQEYDPNANTWTYRASMQVARKFPAVTTLNNRLQVIGGRSPQDATLRSFEEYNPANNTWIKKSDTTTLGGLMGGADIINGKIYLTVFDYSLVEVYDPTVNLWLPAHQLPSPLGTGNGVVRGTGHSITVNGNLYVISGTAFLRGTLGGAVDAIQTISDQPRVTVDANNIAQIVWRDGCYEYVPDGQNRTYITPDCNLFYRSVDLASRNLSPVVVPLSTAQNAREFDIKQSPDNTLHLIFKKWEQSLGREAIFHSKKTDNVWNTPTTAISDYTGQLYDTSLKIAPDGSPQIVGRNYGFAPAMERIYFSQLKNGIWQPLETVVAGSDGYRIARLVHDAGGTPVTIYQRADSNHVFLSKRLGDGSWSRGLIGNPTTQYVQTFDAASAAATNTLFLPYVTYVNGHTEIFMNVANLGLDFIAPVITLNGPTGSNTLTGGSIQPISWNVFDDTGVSSVSLKYSLNGGQSYIDIVNGLANSGSYNWALPNINASTVQLALFASDATGNQSVGTSGSSFSLVERKLISLALTGATLVDEGTTANYTATAYYDNGTSVPVTAILGLDSTLYASLNGTTLTGKMVARNQTVTLNASYTENGIAKSASLIIVVKDLDNTPSPFSFEPVSTALLQSLLYSNPITLSSPSATTSFAISIVGGEYSIDSGRWTKAAGNINVGSRVAVRMLSPARCNTQTAATLSIGGGSSTFTATAQGACTTAGANSTAPAFTFASVFNVQPNAMVESTPILISGMTGAADIVIDGGEYAINDGPWRVTPGQIRNGQLIKVRLIASPFHNAEKKLSLSIGAQSGSFVVTTNARSLVGLQIVGPNIVNAGASADYTLLATYDNGSSAEINGTLNYSGTGGSLTGMRLHAQRIERDQIVILNARYIEDGIDRTQHLPVTIHGTDHPIKATPMIRAGSGSALFLDGNGAIWMTGRNGLNTTEFRQPSRVGALRATAIATGEAHWMALQADGTVMSWGRNHEGQLGLGNTQDALQPTQVPKLANITAIAADLNFSLARDTSGRVWHWGRGIDTPMLLPELGQVAAMAVSGNQGTIVVLKPDGTVWSWQAGSVSPIPGLSQISAVAAGWSHGLALKQDGTVSGWWLVEPSIDYGQLGNGTVNAVREPRLAVPTVGLDNVVGIAAGRESSIALLRDGSVRVWGGNIRGELGVPSATDGSGAILKPAPVAGLSNILGIASNQNYSGFAFDDNGVVYGWGAGVNGILGNDLWQPRCWLFGCLTLPPARIDQNETRFLLFTPQNKDEIEQSAGRNEASQK